MRTNHITLDPPYRLDASQTDIKFIGWCEIADPESPAIVVEVNGVAVPYKFKPRPDVEAAFPGLRTVGVAFRVDFAEVLRDADTLQDKGGFLLSVRVRADDRERTFEYGVSTEWLRAVFGRPQLRAYPIPPEDLQIRVAGAAAGGFVATGRAVADRIEAILAAKGEGYPKSGVVFDFGAGPGRVLSVLASRHPTVAHTGSDIDPEAIEWCRRELRDVGEFFVNGALPPLNLPSDYVDMAYSISTLTHFPEDMQHAWLAELHRVLKPGGHLLTTKMNPFGYDLPASVRAAAEETGFAYFGDAAPVDGLPDFYRLAYHTEDYVRRVWGEHFEVLHVGSHDLNDTQDAVLLRKRG